VGQRVAGRASDPPLSSHTSTRQKPRYRKRVSVVTANVIVVPMGEYAVGIAPGAIRTSNLGSCVGVAIYDAYTQVGGLAHIVLPDKGGRGFKPAAHADVAIPAMVHALEALGAVRMFMVAKLAGGGNMFGFEVTPAMDIGARNVECVRDVLRNELIRIVAEDLLGNHPRCMMLDLGTGTVILQTRGEHYRSM